MPVSPAGARSHRSPPPADEVHHPPDGQAVPDNAGANRFPRRSGDCDSAGSVRPSTAPLRTAPRAGPGRLVALRERRQTRWRSHPAAHQLGRPGPLAREGARPAPISLPPCSTAARCSNAARAAAAPHGRSPGRQVVVRPVDDRLALPHALDEFGESCSAPTAPLALPIAEARRPQACVTGDRGRRHPTEQRGPIESKASTTRRRASRMATSTWLPAASTNRAKARDQLLETERIGGFGHRLECRP